MTDKMTWMASFSEVEEALSERVVELLKLELDNHVKEMCDKGRELIEKGDYVPFFSPRHVRDCPQCKEVEAEANQNCLKSLTPQERRTLASARLKMQGVLQVIFLPED